MKSCLNFFPLFYVGTKVHCVGQKHVKVRKGNKMKSVLRGDEAYYVPMLENLEKLLNNHRIIEEVGYIRTHAAREMQNMGNFQIHYEVGVNLNFLKPLHYLAVCYFVHRSISSAIIYHI